VEQLTQDVAKRYAITCKWWYKSDAYESNGWYDSAGTHWGYVDSVIPLDPYFWLPRLIVAARERYLATTEIRTKTTILEEIPSAIRAYLVGEADSPIPALCETLEAADD